MADMRIHIEPISSEARKPVVDIFNYYIEHSFAAFPETKVPYEAFDMLLKMCEGYPAVVAKRDSGMIVGFGMLRSYNPFPVFSGTAEISCFVGPEYLHRGIGSSIFEQLVHGARKRKLSTILAAISSLNEPSIEFHRNKGFAERGRFVHVGRKKGRIFDVIWMQKMLEPQ